MLRIILGRIIIVSSGNVIFSVNILQDIRYLISIMISYHSWWRRQRLSMVMPHFVGLYDAIVE